MEKPLLLLPFVHGIDSLALSCALNFARERGATLLLVSLIPLRTGRRVRPEAISQAHDFFALMNFRAQRAGVSIRQIHFSTPQIASSIQHIAQEMACTSILLFVRNGRGILLETEDIKRLLEQPARPIHLFRLASQRNWFAQIAALLLAWFQNFF